MKNRWGKNRMAAFALALCALLAGATACSAQLPAASEDTEEEGETTQIILSDAGSTVSGAGASVNGNQIRITDKGTDLRDHRDPQRRPDLCEGIRLRHDHPDP